MTPQPGEVRSVELTEDNRVAAIEWLAALNVAVDVSVIPYQRAAVIDDRVALMKLVGPDSSAPVHGPDGWMIEVFEVPFTVDPAEFGLEWCTQ